MTRTTPFRRITRQCSHNLFTEARTFILLVLVFLVSFHNPSLGKVIRAHFEHYFLAQLRALKQLARGPRRMTHQPVAILELNSHQSMREHLDYSPPDSDGFGPGHVKISGSPSVTAMVCSQCAEGRPSRATTVQPSGWNFTFAVPAFTIGSIAKVIPGLNSGVLAPLTKFGICGSS